MRERERETRRESKDKNSEKKRKKERERQIDDTVVIAQTAEKLCAQSHRWRLKNLHESSVMEFGPTIK